jgi:hypothetical protein
MGHASRAGQGINGHRSEPDQLATMSIGWPPASSVSARVVGVRPVLPAPRVPRTELIGAGTCLAAIAFFLLTMGDGQVWQPVASTFVLGFGSA